MISIILINYNNSEETLDCLKSLSKQNYSDYEIIIVDNNSNKKQKDILRNHEYFQKYKKYKNKIKLIFLKNNYGFTGGNNAAIKYTRGEIILLLNSDTFQEVNFLKSMNDYFTKNKIVHIAQPKICFFPNTNLIWSNGGIVNIYSPKLFSHLNYLEYDDNQFELPFKIDYAVGCAIFIRREVINDIGLFDNVFFMYGEETDFCYRATKKGYKIFCNPNSRIYHKINVKKSAAFKKYYFRNRNIWCIKNLSIFLVIWQFFMQFIHLIGLTKNHNNKKVDYNFFFKSIIGIFLGIKIGIINKIRVKVPKKIE